MVEVETFKLGSFKLELGLKVSELLLQFKDLLLLLSAFPIQVVTLQAHRQSKQT